MMGEAAPRADAAFAEGADDAHLLNTRDRGAECDWSAGPRKAWLPVWERARRG